MTHRAPQYLRGVNPRDEPVAFACAPWLDSQYVLDDDIILQYSYHSHHPDDISLLALECDDF